MLAPPPENLSVFSRGPRMPYKGPAAENLDEKPTPIDCADDVHDEIVVNIARRASFEDRIRMLYELRYTGLRRQNKPWANAADLHFMLADGIIEKTKPFYLAQFYANQTMATFVSRIAQARGMDGACEEYFDYQVKQRSNFEEEILYGIDQMCQAGRGIIKTSWDERRARLRYESVLMIDMIMPVDCGGFEDADWCVHVLRMSKAAYKRNPRYNQDPDFIEKISGDASDGQTKKEGFDAVRAAREGTTTTQNSDKMIVLWERYTRVTLPTGDKDEAGDPILKTVIKILTYSPEHTKEGPARKEFEMPYDHMEMPFASAPYEVTAKGWHTPRGIVEIVANNQTYMTRLWNTKADFLTLTTMPVFGTNKEIPNGANIAMEPGKCLPYQAQAIQFPTPPMSLDQEMQFTQGNTEYRIGMPDFGLAGRRDGGQGKPTATEISRISDVMNQSQDIRVRIFRIFAGKVWKQSWALLCQYDKGKSKYMSAAGFADMNQEAMHLDYEISPSGSADSWNKGARMQRAVARVQLLSGNQYINQGELTKSYLEDDDVTLVERLYQDPQTRAAEAKEEQAIEISIMLLGFPAEIHPYDQDIDHLDGLLDWMHSMLARGTPPTPEQAILVLAHTNAHVKQATEKGMKDQLGQMLPALRDLENALTAILKSAIIRSVQPPTPSPMSPMSGAGARGVAPAGMPVGSATGMGGGTSAPPPELAAAMAPAGGLQ